MPFSGFEWSISSPGGISGVSEQVHVGDGHVDVVGKGGSLWWVTYGREETIRRIGCHGDRVRGRKNIRLVKGGVVMSGDLELDNHLI